MAYERVGDEETDTHEKPKPTLACDDDVHQSGVELQDDAVEGVDDADRGEGHC